MLLAILIQYNIFFWIIFTTDTRVKRVISNKICEYS